VDAARGAGATYAEARLTRQVWEQFNGSALGGHREEFGVAVRALYNGYWGFAGSPYWNPDDVVDQARNAASQAKVYARGRPHSVEWAPIPVASGSWSTPIKYDPFTIPIEEKADHAASWAALAREFHPHASGAMLGMSFVRRECAVATSEGAYFTQTTYMSGGRYVFLYKPWKADGNQDDAEVDAEGLMHTGAGWELFLDAKIPDQFPALLARCEAMLREEKSEPKPGDVGRYTIVCDALTMANILVNTIGVGTQLDLALGYEANTGMTSYLGPDPMTFLGTPVASPLVTVRADRSMPRGLATVQWDAEGVRPEPFTLVEHGTLVDYQTTREQASWLAPWYKKRGKAIRSNGCANAESGLFTTMQHLPNLVLEPGPRDIGFETLVASTPRGLAIQHGSGEPNFNGGQMLLRHFGCREIVDGRLGRPVQGIVPLFSSTDFWKHVVALGGPSSAAQYPIFGVNKGEPGQSTPFSVKVVPAQVTNVAFINGARADR
jgi:TldD protein